jgi:hypothetical protein
LLLLPCIIQIISSIVTLLIPGISVVGEWYICNICLSFCTSISMVGWLPFSHEFRESQICTARPTKLSSTSPCSIFSLSPLFPYIDHVQKDDASCRILGLITDKTTWQLNIKSHEHAWYTVYDVCKKHNFKIEKTEFACSYNGWILTGICRRIPQTGDSVYDRLQHLRDNSKILIRIAYMLNKLKEAQTMGFIY